jgi:hypothetical protein
MIDDALAKTERGVNINAKVGQVLEEIVTKVRKVAEIVAQAAQASGEQSNGIGQVNTAIASMDKVTQSNAASAEECASASEELSAQAANMKEAVADLLEIVEGSRQTQGTDVHASAAASFAQPRASAAPVRQSVVRTQARSGSQRFLSASKTSQGSDN